MTKNRLEAFSDGVLAIVITIMVLEMKVPHGTEWGDLARLWPVFLSYVLSFVFIGIYWNNHHHLMHAVHHVDGRVMWPNMHLLFWLSLMPFVTGWMGENHFAAKPVALYGCVLLAAGFAYWLLVRALIAVNGSDSHVARAVGDDRKGNLSLVLYVIAIPIALFVPMVACLLYAVVAVMWVIPDRRIERVLTDHQG